MDDDMICPELQPDEEAILHDLMNFASDKAPNEVLMGDEKVDLSSKGKTKVCYDETWQNQVKDATASDPGKSSTSSNNLNSSHSELSYHGGDADDGLMDDNADDGLMHDDADDGLLDDDADDGLMDDNADDGLMHDDADDGLLDDDADDGLMDADADDVYDYGDDNYMYEDDYETMQSQFDNVDLPSGVETSLSWLIGHPANQDTTATSTSIISDLSERKRTTTIPDLTESKRKATISDLDENKSKEASSSHSTVPGESSSDVKEENGESRGVPNLQHFKQFATVDDFFDHHYSGMGFRGEQPPKNWAKKIQEEWKILEKNLPDTIFVRVCESRMELLRAVMIGPSGTPYHDGLFVFDCLFPPSYPNEPPRVYYYSGGLRLNPNLYECGKVCLSLLGTWSGKATEMWDKKNSTMLQVLVSIQALILNAKPFFNEPGYENSYVGEEGEKRSRSYNEATFISSLKTMMYTLRKPPKHFEDLVAEHFRNCARDILVTCKAYMEGAVVGYVVVKDGIPKVDQVEGRNSRDFKHKLGQMMNILITNFTRNGSTDCEQFRISSGRR